jgi:hypothetical protein
MENGSLWDVLHGKCTLPPTHWHSFYNAETNLVSVIHSQHYFDFEGFFSVHLSQNSKPPTGHSK